MSARVMAVMYCPGSTVDYTESSEASGGVGARGVVTTAGELGQPSQVGLHVSWGIAAEVIGKVVEVVVVDAADEGKVVAVVVVVVAVMANLVMDGRGWVGVAVTGAGFFRGPWVLSAEG